MKTTEAAALILAFLLVASQVSAATAEESGPPDLIGTSVFEELARDPYMRRYGHEPGDGWIPMSGTETEFRFGGFVQLNVIHDFNDAGYPYGDFIPALIPVPTDNTSNTEFDARTSRFTFETRSNTKEAGSIRTMISLDFAGQVNAGSIQPRLRQACVSWVGPKSNISFTAGQTWTTYYDPGVWPDLFDLEGPNAMTGLRQGLIRGSYVPGKNSNWVLDASLEQPESAVADGTGLRGLPDLVLRANSQQGWGHLQGAVVARQLMAESSAGEDKDSAFGWGLSLSGSWKVPGTKRAGVKVDDLGERQDSVQFQIQGGDGSGRYVYDPGAAPIPQDAVYDNATGELHALGEFGAFAAYHHWWSGRVRSQFAYGYVSMNTQDIQPDSAFDSSTYLVLNLIYRAFRRMDVGLEYYHGKRVEKDGAKGEGDRILLGVNFGF